MDHKRWEVPPTLINAILDSVSASYFTSERLENEILDDYGSVDFQQSGNFSRQEALCGGSLTYDSSFDSGGAGNSQSLIETLYRVQVSLR